MAISHVSSTNPLDQLAKSLVDRVDANGDGPLTTQEFTSFMTNLLHSVAPGAAVNAASVNAATKQKCSKRSTISGMLTEGRSARSDGVPTTSRDSTAHLATSQDRSGAPQVGGSFASAQRLLERALQRVGLAV
jgi:hypothetical protein